LDLESSLSIKQKLLFLCFAFVDERIASARQAIHLAQASANEETKSSAGDKYETGRAMAQLEIEKSGVQLNEALRVKKTLEQINLTQVSTSVQPGSLVFTTQGVFFISVSAGKLSAYGVTCYAVSPLSPVGAALMGLRAEASVIFNQKELRIEKIV
jgi:hypothetical protein